MIQVNEGLFITVETLDVTHDVQYKLILYRTVKIRTDKRDVFL
jgi:hypothetical protein